LAALAIGSGWADKKYDPYDSADVGNAKCLSPPDQLFGADGHGVRVPGGILYISYERELGKQALLRIRYHRINTATVYAGVFTAQDLGLYSCYCCRGRSRQIMRSAATITDSRYLGLIAISCQKGGLQLWFKGSYGTDSKVKFRVILPKTRPHGTVAYSRQAAEGSQKVVCREHCRHREHREYRKHRKPREHREAKKIHTSLLNYTDI
jgi:hypothetical protein